MPIEKFAYIVPMPGQGKRVMKSKLLTALGATGPNRPYTANPEHILERKILLQTPFNYNPSTPVVPVVPTNGLLNNLVHYYQFQEAAAPFADVGSNPTALSYFNAGLDFSRVAGFVSPFAGNYDGANGFNGIAAAATPTDFAGGNAGSLSTTFSIWFKPSSTQPQIARTPGLICVWDDDSNANRESWVVVMDAADVTNFKLFSRDTGGGIHVVNQHASSDTWHLMQGGWDASNNTLWISIDNAAPTAVAQTSLRTTTGGSTFVVANLNVAQRELHVAFSDVGIWQRAFSATDRSNLWNGGAGLLFSKFTT